MREKSFEIPIRIDPTPIGPIAVGLGLAALAPGLCLAGYTLFVDGSAGGALFVLVVSGAVAAVPTSLLGLPYVAWLRAHRRLTWRNVCLGAALIGSVTMAAITWTIASVWNTPTPDAWDYLLGAGLGLAAGLAFCGGARLSGVASSAPVSRP
ncbi:MAG: hypothetical protein ACK6DF_16920 [Betaproteobacteria bacterium]